MCRPHVSDDNPFSEAQFKTVKYQPDYPGRFSGVLHVRGWIAPFFAWHNDDHQHSGLTLFTPAEVFFGRVPEVHRIRQAALDAQYALHPHRFPNGRSSVFHGTESSSPIASNVRPSHAELESPPRATR